MVTLRIREPDVYRKVLWCDVLSQLLRFVSLENLPDLPLHVLDKDKKRLAQLRH